MNKRLILYLVIVFVLTYALGAVAYYMGGIDKFPVAQFSMLIPGLVILLLYIIWKKKLLKGNDLGLRFTGWKYWIIAPLTIFGILSISYGISYLVRPDAFLQFAEIKQNFTEHSINKGGSFLTNIVLIFCLNILIAPILNFPIFLGEELGWRAYLTPQLLKHFSTAKAFVLSGCIWALWHLFGIIMGLNYPGNWYLGIVLMILFCIPIGVIFQYFYHKSTSIFVTIMCHGALNWTGSTIMMFLANDKKWDFFLLGPTGITGIIILWIFGFMFYRSFVKENLKEKITIEN